jgi:hypothetical protein
MWVIPCLALSQTLACDLFLLRRVCVALRSLPQTNSIDLVGVVDELAMSMFNELDYTQVRLTGLSSRVLNKTSIRWVESMVKTVIIGDCIDCGHGQRDDPNSVPAGDAER